MYETWQRKNVRVSSKERTWHHLQHSPNTGWISLSVDTMKKWRIVLATRDLPPIYFKRHVKRQSRPSPWVKRNKRIYAALSTLLPKEGMRKFERSLCYWHHRPFWKAHRIFKLALYSVEESAKNEPKTRRILLKLERRQNKRWKHISTV